MKKLRLIKFAYLSISIGMLVEFEKTQYNKKDIKWLISTVLCNSIVTFTGFKLYAANIISLDFSTSIFSVGIDFLKLLLLMDFLMFAFHAFIHRFSLLYHIHSIHHTHISTNVYSLFVLHPIEVFGFGGIWISLLILLSFNFYAIVIYTFFNLAWGILGHLNTSIGKNIKGDNRPFIIITDTKFHHIHHENEHKNFGFYFTIWDIIFKTKQNSELA